ncbi:CHC2 zinc finger domain-containing protein [Acidobacteria bacterium AH-259-G07]|nr:CHC2 zinc finger domain-containing protein [Acidobacteria bacterium AH-259-G07]
MKENWVNFKKVKEEVRFQAILDRYGVKLKSTNGRELLGHCPFHEDKNPSFRVNTQKRVFYCFGCGAKGNVLDFVSQKEVVSIREAALLLSEWFDMRETMVGPPGANQRPKTHNTSQKEKRPEAINHPLTFTLKLDPDHPYLKERGLDAQVVKFFGLGYCKRGLMKNRIAIPIHDEKGKLAAYAGRWAGDELPEGEEKYKLPLGFKKSHVLFNLHRVTEAKIVVIVEGYWSVFRLYQLGVQAVALMGNTLSQAQENLLLKSKARCFILLLDGDEPGRQAQDKILLRIARHFFVKSVSLPAGKQPDTVDEHLLFQLLKTKDRW